MRTVRKRRTRAASVIVAGCAGLALVGGWSSAAQAAPVPIACGSLVSVNAVLSHDLNCTNGHGLTLSSGVSLDLQGHTITGPGANNTSGATGITVDGPVYGTISNGTIRNWPLGVVERTGASLDVTGIHLIANGTGLYGAPLSADISDTEFRANTQGVYGKVANVEVYTSTATGNHYGFVVQGGGGIDFESTTMTGNRYGVFCQGARVSADNSSFVANTTGIYSSTCAPQLNASAFTDNATGLIDVAPAPGRGAIDTVVTDRFSHNQRALDVRRVSIDIIQNTFTDNGISFDGAVSGILGGNHFVHNIDAVNASSPPLNDPTITWGVVEYSENSAIDNTGWGLRAPGAQDDGGNTAHGNGNQPQCVGLVCGP